MKRIVTFSILLTGCLAVKAQDLIYLTNGTKFKGIVSEINITDVKYKSENNPTGPTYVITKNDVLMIEYKNGDVDILNKNPKSVSPQAVEPTPVKKEKKEIADNDIYYANKNTVMINGLALANADVTLMYQRDFAQNHCAAYLLGGYNFNQVTTWPNAFVQGLANSKKNYDIGIGFNYFPSTRRKSQYFVGLLIKYMSFTYDKTVYETVDINGFSYQQATSKRFDSYQIATMIVNGFQFRLTPSINYQIFAGVGGFNARGDLKDQIFKGGGSGSTTSSGTSTPGFAPKMYLGMCFGYRF